AVRALVDRVLEIAVEKAVADAAGEGRRNLRDVAHLNHALDLAPRDEAQRHRVDESEQAVAADGEAEELRVFGTAAGLEIALRVEAEHTVELADVDQDSVGGEGLSAHRVAAARDAHGAVLAPGGGDRRARGS